MRKNDLPAYAVPFMRNQCARPLVMGLAMLFFVTSDVFAQDTTSVEPEVVIETVDTLDQEVPDTVAIRSYAERFDPRKAILFAAILPGLGQAYNRKYWKLPLVYGGFALIGYYMNTYNNVYTEYKGYLFDNLEMGRSAENAENPEIDLTTGQLRTIVNKARRERDFMIILMGGMYILQMVDAHVDAHLKEFDLNPRLQVSVEPAMEQNLQAGRTIGLALVVRF